MDIVLGTVVKKSLTAITVCAGYYFQKITKWSKSKCKSMLYPSMQVEKCTFCKEFPSRHFALIQSS